MKGVSTMTGNCLMILRILVFKSKEVFYMLANKMAELNESTGRSWTKLRLYALMHAFHSPGGNLLYYMQSISTTGCQSSILVTKHRLRKLEALSLVSLTYVCLHVEH